MNPTCVLFPGLPVLQPLLSLDLASNDSSVSDSSSDALSKAVQMNPECARAKSSAANYRLNLVEAALLQCEAAQRDDPVRRQKARQALDYVKFTRNKKVAPFKDAEQLLKEKEDKVRAL